MPIGVVFEVPNASAKEYDAGMAQLGHRNAGSGSVTILLRGWRPTVTEPRSRWV